MATIVTNCSKRKRLAPDATLLARTLIAGSLDAVVRQWQGRIEAAQPQVEAGRLYCGRQFHEARQASRRLDAELLIVSAGLGVVRPDDLVPSYSITVATGVSDSVLSKVQDVATAAEWWRETTKPGSDSKSLQTALEPSEDTDGLILIALPAPYLSMIEDEVAKFPAERLARTRLFTQQSFRFRNAGLSSLRMPYDARLDGPESPSPGTATDFSSRALRDFVEYVLPDRPEGNCEDHAAAVAGRLSGWPPAPRPDRKRLPDSELREIIRANWSHSGSSASGMLRRVRRELGLACEQGRMRELHASVRAEMEEVS